MPLIVEAKLLQYSLLLFSPF